MPHGRTSIATPHGALGAIEARAERPVGLAIALHGSGYDANYWDHPVCPAASLPTLAPRLGFDVVAIDRPGYAGSLADFPEGLSLDLQIPVLFDAIARVRRDAAQPVFLIGHSMGGILSLLMAADPRAEGVITAIDVMGVPLVMKEAQTTMMRRNLEAVRESGQSFFPNPDREMRLALFYGAPGTFDERVVAWGPTEHAIPVAEMPDARSCPEKIPALGGRIAVPVQWTCAAVESTSVTGPEVIAHARTCLPNVARFAGFYQQDCGHNASLHHVGRAYHLRALAFFEEAAALARTIPA